MKNRFIFPNKTQMIRFEVVNPSIDIQVSSEINPQIRSLAMILFNKRLIQAGYL